MMKASELKEKSNAELQTMLHDLLREQFDLRMQKGLGETLKPLARQTVRRNIARVKTVLNEKANQ
jgi:large subunit ribosomal protein L29